MLANLSELCRRFLDMSPARPRDVGQEQREEPLNQPPHAGQAEVNEEGAGGEEGGGGENDHPVCEDEVTDLQNRDCRFSEADAERKVGPRVALDKSYQENSKKHSADIDKEYNRVFPLRSEINALLAGFKQRLELQEHMNLSVCFKNLRKLVGLYDTLEFDKEAMKIIIDPNADEDAVEAVNKFNMMLEKCHEFQEKLQTSKPVMEEKLMALEKESTQTQETLDATARAKNQLKCVLEWEADVKHIIFETKTSSIYQHRQHQITSLLMAIFQLKRTKEIMVLMKKTEEKEGEKKEGKKDEKMKGEKGERVEREEEEWEEAREEKKMKGKEGKIMVKVTDLQNRDCRFSEADAERKVGPRVALDKSYQENSKKHSADIDKEYNRVFPLRSEINALLAGFKQRLELQEHMNLSVCFKNLRKLVGLYDTLEFDKEAMKIIIDPNADEDAVEAVNKFNMMLEKCHEFQEKLQTSKPVMEEKLMALEKENMQTQETLDAIARAKNQLKCVQEWEADVKHIIFDTKTSSKLFTSGRIVTGLH
ncbi:hypothetical protein GBAR_LOCUS1316 [Geodia barretti]|uniref:Uncharacterized protein n=1 Tax=Geodia barretti TaxID=519541 RepID=A0AA35QWD6_GEOBA|nr:hypothetical protein GBAR_LOCUS1316 [Geodia barretti]